MTQKERQDRSREEIYRAALEEFGTLGYDNVSMERICTQHSISKGMMYHYYSNKDALFLLCVKQTFADLKLHIEHNIDALVEQDILETIKNFFMIRECFFQLHPKQKVIFEDAMLHPPKHLTMQIQELRAPIREVNRQFIHQLVQKMPLRAEIDPQKAARYLESIEYFFQSVLQNYQGNHPKEDLHEMFAAAGEMLDMILFGILQQPQTRSTPPSA